MGRNFATGPGAADAFGYGFGVFFWLLGLVLLYGSITVFAYSTRVEITHRAVRIVRRWYMFQRNDVLVSDVREVIGAEFHHMVWVGRGPAPQRYTVALVFADGLKMSMQSTIYRLDDARALAADITASIRQAVEQPDALQAPTVQAAR